MKTTEMLAQREHVHKGGVLCRRKIRSRADQLSMLRPTDGVLGNIGCPCVLLTAQKPHDYLVSSSIGEVFVVFHAPLQPPALLLYIWLNVHNHWSYVLHFIRVLDMRYV